MASFLKGFVGGFAKGANKRFRAVRKHKGEMEIEKLKAQNRLDVEALSLMKTKQAADDKARHKAKADAQKASLFNDPDLEEIYGVTGRIPKVSTDLGEQAAAKLNWLETAVQNPRSRGMLDQAVAGNPDLKARIEGMLRSAGTDYSSPLAVKYDQASPKSAQHRWPLSDTFKGAYAWIVKQFPGLEGHLNSGIVSQASVDPREYSRIERDGNTFRFVQDDKISSKDVLIKGYGGTFAVADAPVSGDFQEALPQLKRMMVSALTNTQFEAEQVSIFADSYIQHKENKMLTDGVKGRDLDNELADAIISATPRMRRVPGGANQRVSIENLTEVKDSFKQSKQDSTGKLLAIAQLRSYTDRYGEIIDALEGRILQGGVMGKIGALIEAAKAELRSFVEYSNVSKPEHAAITMLDKQMQLARISDDPDAPATLALYEAQKKVILQGLEAKERAEGTPDEYIVGLLGEKNAIKTLMSFTVATTIQPQSSRVSDRDFILLENIASGLIGGLGLGNIESERAGLGTLVDLADSSWSKHKFRAAANSDREYRAMLNTYRALVPETGDGTTFENHKQGTAPKKEGEDLGPRPPGSFKAKPEETAN